jgi:predicted membrane channel-forming protein YqfA (hemolysin III family)
MRRRTRKFIGAALMLGFVIVYALLAMALAQGRFIQDAPGFLQAIFYVVLGMAWVLPVMPLIKWMERPDQDDLAV